jgi:phage tail sheath protein FI
MSMTATISPKAPGVYVQEVDSGSRPIEGVGTAVAAFVGLAERGESNKPTLIANWKQFVSEFGSFTKDGYLAHAVYGYFLNGGGNCYVVRIGGGDGDEPLKGELTAKADDKAEPQPRYEVRAKASAPLDAAIEVEVADTPKTDGSDGDAPDSFKLTVRRGGEVIEEWSGLSPSRGKQGAATIVNEQSQLISLVEVSGAPLVRPTPSKITLASTDRTPVKLEATDYVGDPADRTGFGGLETIEDVTMVCVPDLMAALEQKWVDLEGVKAVQTAMIAHCEQMGDRVAIIDPPPGYNAQQIIDWRRTGAGYDSKYATLYWPWVEVADPFNGKTKAVPPCGHIAGVWGRNDDTRGVHKAPANEVVRGVTALAQNITSKEQELLNPDGINCIRAFSGRGIRVWGARTLASDPAWKYVNVRRLFNYLEESILNGTQWVVFEPNDDALWARIRRTISDFLTNEWRKGALFGLTPDEAFFVKCDRETNPPDSVDLGKVICEIGVAPVKPAEFVIFTLSQFSGGAALNE